MFPEASRRFAPAIAVLAIVGIIYGALVAMMQVDLKRLVAYSSVSHLGFVVLGIFAFHATSIQGAIYQILSHGISTGALFLGVGMLYDRRHTHLIREYGGLATPAPVLSALPVRVSGVGRLADANGWANFVLVTTSRAGGPPGPPWESLSAVYLLWSWPRWFFGRSPASQPPAARRRSSRTRHPARDGA
jgi:NADH-quinone oxidoreductase subunit M